MWGKPFDQIFLLFFKSSAERERVHHTKFPCPNTVRTVQSKCNQQDALTKKSMLVKPAEILFQNSSVKPSQLGLQGQSKSAKNNLEILGQSWSTKVNAAIKLAAVNAGQLAQKISISVPEYAACQTEILPQKTQSNKVEHCPVNVGQSSLQLGQRREQKYPINSLQV